MATTLTSVAVRNAKATGGVRRELPDGRSGLYLVVQPSGAKSWALRYRFHGKPVKLTLGPALSLQGSEDEPAREPEVGKPLTLSGARFLAAALTRKIARGEDPSAQLREAKQAKTKQEVDPDLFEVVAVDFITRYARAANRESSWRETARLLGFKPDATDPTKLVRRKPEAGVFAGAAAHWEGRRIQDLGRRDVVDLLDAIADGGAPFSANRAFAAVRKLFNWCVERDRLAVSPCRGVKPPTQEVSRDRVLTDDELVLIWKGSDALGTPFGQFIKVLLLTGQRRDEVAEMTWDELDLDQGLWLLPRERVKNDTAHEVPLSSQAIGILKSLPRFEGTPAYVFTTGSGRRRATLGQPKRLSPISGFSKAKARLDRAVEDTSRQAEAARGFDVADFKPMEGWRLHDLRRTMASGMARLGISLPVIEKVLNHRSGSFAGIVGVYQRHSFSAEKQVALQAWGDFVEGVVSGVKSDNVVPLRTGAR